MGFGFPSSSDINPPSSSEASEASHRAPEGRPLVREVTTPPLGPPYGPMHMLLQGPTGGGYLMSEVPL